MKILLNHKWDRVLGGTKSNLKLKEEIVGLRAQAEITDPEVIKAAKEKRLRGWSFDIMRPSEQRAELPNGMPLRTITDFDISEVSLITNMRPWYESTTVETRAGEDGEITVELRAEEFEAEYVGFEDKQAKEKEPNLSKLKEKIEKYGGKVKEER